MAVAHGVRTIEVIRAVAPDLDAEAEVRKLESREADDREVEDHSAQAAQDAATVLRIETALAKASLTRSS